MHLALAPVIFAFSRGTESVRVGGYGLLHNTLLSRITFLSHLFRTWSQALIHIQNPQCCLLGMFSKVISLLHRDHNDWCYYTGTDSFCCLQGSLIRIRQTGPRRSQSLAMIWLTYCSRWLTCIHLWSKLCLHQDHQVKSVQISRNLKLLSIHVKIY